MSRGGGASRRIFSCICAQYVCRPVGGKAERERGGDRERAPSTKSQQCVPRPTSGVQEQGAGLEGVQTGLMRFPSTPSACQGPSGFLPAYLECI